MAKSHIRLNRGHSYTVFRVRLGPVKPKTTRKRKASTASTKEAAKAAPSAGKAVDQIIAVPFPHASSVLVMRVEDALRIGVEQALAVL